MNLNTLATNYIYLVEEVVKKFSYLDHDDLFSELQMVFLSTIKKVDVEKDETAIASFIRQKLYFSVIDFMRKSNRKKIIKTVSLDAAYGVESPPQKDRDDYAEIIHFIEQKLVDIEGVKRSEQLVIFSEYKAGASYASLQKIYGISIFQIKKIIEHIEVISASVRNKFEKE